SKPLLHYSLPITAAPPNQGVEADTGSTFPLKKKWPSAANQAMKAPIFSELTGAWKPGKASASISVCTEPRQRQLQAILFSFHSSARHSARLAMAALLSL